MLTSPMTDVTQKVAVFCCDLITKQNFTVTYQDCQAK